MSNLTEQQLELREHARALATKKIAPRAAEVDRSEEYPWDNVEALTKAGYMGMTIPEEYGGLGLGYLDAALVVEEMAKVCGVTGRIVVEGNMGAIGAIMKYGSEAQKRLAAELVLAGDKPAICITEPEAGSAASQMTTRAERKGDGYVLNGRKHWITGGGVSKLHLIFARVFENNVEQGIGGGGSGDGGEPDIRNATYPISIPKPIIAAVNGACAGLGLVHALACDLRFAAEGAKFTVAFSRRGLIAEHGLSWTMPRLVGQSVALDLIMSGRVFLADEAKELGIVNRVCPPEALLDETLAYADDLATNASPTSMAIMKHQIYNHPMMSLSEAMAESNRLMRESLRRPDFKEGVASFVEKRVPNFAPYDPDD